MPTEPSSSEPSYRPTGRLPVAVLGATGSVGQRFVSLLADHPWFEIQALTASERSAGKPYREACTWLQPHAIPQAVAAMELSPTEPEAAAGCRLAFSALDDRISGEAEEAFAGAGILVVSNSKSYRMHPRVPLVVPEVNPDHLDLAATQGYGQGGAILTNPNCSTIGLVLALKPLVDAFGVERVHVVSLQAVSGAGLPGVPSIQAIDNLIPYIGNEEEKIEAESAKIFGTLAEAGDERRIEPAGITVSAACNRVPVIDGHTLCVSVGLGRRAELDEVRATWEGFSAEPQHRGLPTAPAKPVHILEGDAVPQPRLHRDLDGGMAASVGRLRPCPLFDWKFVTLSHNTLRGAAGGALLLAELAVARGLLER